MKKGHLRLSKSILILICMLSTVCSTVAQAAGRDAYKYVTSVCTDGNPLPLWSQNQRDEFNYALENMAEGLSDSVIDTNELVKRVTTDPYTAQMKEMLDSDGFAEGLRTCFPDSEIKRNLLAFRIIMTGAGGYTIGTGIGLFSGLKLFSYAAKALGFTTLKTLRYVGVSEKALVSLRKSATVFGYVVLGVGVTATVYPDVESAIQRYKYAKEGEENRNSNLTEINELQELNQQILLMMEVSRPNEHARLQSQLTKVNQLIQLRVSLL